MTPMSNLYAPTSVPYRHTVPAVAQVAAVSLDLNRPQNPFSRAPHQDHSRQSNDSRGRYSVNSAAPGFAAQILVEAGLADTDPFASMRGAHAYSTSQAAHKVLRLVA